MKSCHSIFTAIVLFLAIASSASRVFALPEGEGLFLVATGSAIGSTYVTKQLTGSIMLTNTGINTVHITSISSTDSDFVRGYITLGPVALPINLATGTSVQIPVIFAPNGATILAGERSYSARLTILSDAATVTATVTGTGVLIHAAISAATALHAAAGDTVVVPVTIDKWIDPLGAPLAGFEIDLLHYRRTILRVDPAFNTSGAGQTNTQFSHANFRENIAIDTMTDPAHNSGSQGYYSLLVSGINPAITSGTMFNLRFIALNVTDTSALPISLGNFTDQTGNAINYIVVTSSAGGIRVDSTPVILAVHPGSSSPQANAIVLHAGSPNPFSNTTDVRFTLAQNERATLYVCDALGRVVATLASGEFGVGEHHALFSAGTLPNGQYYAVLRTPAGIVKQDLALVR